jgi:chromosomal replication initiator protein
MADQRREEGRDVTTATSPMDVSARLADRLATTFGPRRYELWFKRSARFAYNGDHGRLRVSVPSRFVADWIARNFGDQLDQAVRCELGDDVRVEVCVDPAGFAPAPPGSATTPGSTTTAGSTRVNGSAAGRVAARADGAATTPFAGAVLHASPPSIGLQPFPAAAMPPRRAVTPTASGVPLRHALDDFIVGPSNQLAHAAAARLIDDHGQPAHPVFIHGGCGLGKTHLLQGVCSAYIKRHQASRLAPPRVLYTTGEQFTNDYITAVRTNKLDAFRKRVRSLDLLAVDDVHFIANKQATQQEFLHSFDQIELGGARVILASDCHPKLIKQFSEALISRCVRGLVVQVHRPDAATRIKLVESLAQRRGLRLAAGVAQVLADRCEGSVREIEGLLTKLSALASLPMMGRSAIGGTGGAGPGGAAIGHAVLRQLFDHDPAAARPRKPVRFETILAGVCEQFGVTRQQVLGSSRHKHVVLARQMAIHLAREMTPMSYPEIAAAMDRPNHSTVITAAQRAQKQLKADDPILVSMGDPSSQAVRPTELVDMLRRTVLAMA